MLVYIRWEAVRLSSVRQGVQSVVQPHHTQSQAHRLQTVRVRVLPQGVPAQGWSTTSRGNSARDTDGRERYYITSIIGLTEWSYLNMAWSTDMVWWYSAAQLMTLLLLVLWRHWYWSDSFICWPGGLADIHFWKSVHCWLDDATGAEYITICFIVIYIYIYI